MRIQVEGGVPLNGTYTPGGSANAAAACLAAALMTAHPVTLDNVPRTTFTAALLELASFLGAQIAGGGETPFELTTAEIAHARLTPDVTGGMVGGLLFAAPVLARRGSLRLEVDYPLHRIRTHLEALRGLGQDVRIVDGAVEIGASNWEYRDVLLSQASVTATGMAILLAAALGRETVIRNAASEPHVQALAHMAARMGALVDGIGSNTVTVFGARELVGTHVTLPPDHIEAASAAAMIAMTGGSGRVEGVHGADLRMIERTFQRFGMTLELTGDTVIVPRHDALTISRSEEDVDASIESAPWPGFPSDLIPMATVVASQARGTSLIHEKMFDNRLLFVDKLNGMGAQAMLCDPHRVIVIGPSRLYGTYLDTPDVRAGLSLLAAALVADGRTTVDNAQAIARSFEGVLGKLQGLGAKIEIGGS